MSRAKLLVLVAGIAFGSMIVSPAFAQDGPTITVDPAEVPEVGSYEFTVTGEGFVAEGSIFIVPCAVPESGDVDDFDDTTCDTGALNTATLVDGGFEVTVSYDVPEGGLAIGATDANSTEGDVFFVAIATDAPVEEEPAEELADTGAETGVLAVAGLTVVVGGAMLVRSSRRRR